MLVGTTLPGLMLTIPGNQAFIQQTFKTLTESLPHTVQGVRSWRCHREQSHAGPNLEDL